MLRDIISNKWIIGAVVLLMIIAGMCFFWYQRITARYEEEAAEFSEFVRQWEIDRKANAKNRRAETSLTQQPANNKPTAEKPKSDTTAITDKIGPTQTDTTTPTTENQEVRVSKFGFGPYPELPADFPWQDLFDPPYYSEDPNDEYKDNPNYELMHRLWVELWKRGEKVEGMGRLGSTGLFYPTIRGTIYVKWAPRWKVFGQEIGRKIRYIDGHPDDMARLRDAETERDIPSDLKVLDISEGIDPYTFLDLPK